MVPKFGMGDVKVPSAPFEPGSQLGLAKARFVMHPQMADVPYRRIVGRLIYLALCMRLDLSIVVSALERFR